ncbi:hypothetical protein FIBSPDRAFT_884149 [Athelia psychrophila]|uniref:Uncharacterized protein n=1 Tax=Athelia psychrophila TaxID=1759441 RepID=A0A166THJ5_9AGAM|nr:hypothetical protein FIBSPDRAFT_884149 [Fibularhizoctonia sp. CBS 109695]
MLIYKYLLVKLARIVKGPIAGPIHTVTHSEKGPTKAAGGGTARNGRQGEGKQVLLGRLREWQGREVAWDTIGSTATMGNAVWIEHSSLICVMCTCWMLHENPVVSHLMGIHQRATWVFTLNEAVLFQVFRSEGGKTWKVGTSRSLSYVVKHAEEDKYNYESLVHKPGWGQAKVGNFDEVEYYGWVENEVQGNHDESMMTYERESHIILLKCYHYEYKGGERDGICIWHPYLTECLEEYTITHAFYVTMGGLHVYNADGTPVGPLDVLTAYTLIKNGNLLLPSLERIESIVKFTKCDKAFAVLGLVIFLLKYVIRFRNGLPLADFEIMVFTHSSILPIYY